MTQEEGEIRVKGLQKEFLSWVEGHKALSAIPDTEFNDIRRKAFASTFEAFRLGVVGLGEPEPQDLWRKFFGWAGLPNLSSEVEIEIQAKCFRTSLEAFRIGAMVARSK